MIMQYACVDSCCFPCRCLQVNLGLLIMQNSMMQQHREWMAIAFCLFLFVLTAAKASVSTNPHLVFVIVDDYGFNDIGYHGINHESAIKTPFLDSLAMAGVRLENYYVQPICTPSRSQLLSGRLQIHTGLQHYVPANGQPIGIPLDNILLPEQLKSCGYATHMVGKWHVGFFEDGYLPWKRGFESYFGYLGGNEDYYTKYTCFKDVCGYDMDSQNGPTNSTYGEYSAFLYARKAKDVIMNHNKSTPLFLYLALQSVHSPLEVPDKYMQQYAHIKDVSRRTYAGMVAAMDETIKNVTDYLKAAGIWDDTLFVFTTDNGGETRAGGNNWPLRGRKYTLWEGGVRGVAFVHGKMLNVPNPNVITNKELMHISDWYPTLLSASQCPLVKGTQTLDGYDQWKSISTYSKTSRLDILHNIDPIYSPSYKKQAIPQFRMGFDTSVHAAIRVGDWKLFTGAQGMDQWVKPPESDNMLEGGVDNDVPDLGHPGYQKMDPKSVQLFNIKYDPYERIEVSSIYPDIVDKLLLKLAVYNSTAVPVNFPPVDLEANPKLHGGFWQPWRK